MTPVALDRAGSWSIYEVTAAGERAFAFVDDASARTDPPYVWAGSARADEYGEVLADVRLHAPGIPAALSTCFARRVTGVGG